MLTALSLAAAVVSAADPVDLDKMYDEVAEIGRSKRKCPAKGGDEICTALAAFLKGSLPGELGATQFGLARPRYTDDGSFVEASGAHLVVGGKPVHLFGLGPDDDNEAKKMAELAAAWWKGSAPSADKVTAGVIVAARGGLAQPVPARLHEKRSARTLQIRPGEAHDVFAIRVFEKKLYMLSLTETRRKNADGSPPLSVSAFGISPP